MGNLYASVTFPVLTESDMSITVKLIHIWRLRYHFSSSIADYDTAHHVHAHILTEARFGLRSLPLPTCVCLSVNNELVRATTCYLFKLESPQIPKRNIGQRLYYIDGSFSLIPMVKLTLEVKISPIACPRDHSPPVQVRISKFAPNVLTFNMPITFWLNRPWPSTSFLI